MWGWTQANLVGLGKTLVTLLSDGELDTLSTSQSDQWLVLSALADGEDVADACGELKTQPRGTVSTVESRAKERTCKEVET